MAFGGVQANSLPNSTTGFRNGSVAVTGLSLAARQGAPAAAATDTGTLVTGTAGANQNALPANFGVGDGNWLAADLANLMIIVDNTDDTADATAAHVNITSRALSAGNAVIQFHNRGAGAVVAGTLSIVLFLPS